MISVHFYVTTLPRRVSNYLPIFLQEHAVRWPLLNSTPARYERILLSILIITIYLDN